MRVVVALAMLMLAGCAEFNGKEAAGYTTLHPSQRTEVFFVCEKYYRENDVKHEHEHIHCDKNKMLQFKFSF